LSASTKQDSKNLPRFFSLSATWRACKTRGKTGGRPKTDPAKLENARILYENSDKTAAEVCEIAGVGRRTFFAHVAAKRNKLGQNLKFHELCGLTMQNHPPSELPPPVLHALQNRKWCEK
jgi:hypothetical protein